jgi:hypothetical protein
MNLKVFNFILIVIFLIRSELIAYISFSQTFWIRGPILGKKNFADQNYIFYCLKLS